MPKKGARILVVDDDAGIVRGLQRDLVAHGFEVFTARNGEEALQAVAHHRLDLILLDLGLPGISGLEVCKEVRAQSSVPIIVISIKGAESVKVEALNLGADDYISKPFGMAEVLARIKAALRRVTPWQSGSDPGFTAGPLKVDFMQRLVLLNEEKVDLSPFEYDLLYVLIMNRGKLLTHEILLSRVWGTNYSSEPHYLHVY